MRIYLPIVIQKLVLERAKIPGINDRKWACIPNETQKLVLERAKIPRINDRKWARIDLILAHLRSLIRGNFRAAPKPIFESRSVYIPN